MAAVIYNNYVVEIATPTPRRWTPYRGGLIVLGNTYSTRRIDCPDITEEDNPAPIDLTLSIANADNLATDLVTNTANRRAVVTIRRIVFDSSWTITSSGVWFLGRTGKPGFEGSSVTLECHAETGRNGNSPTKMSRTLMTSHTPPAAGAKSPWFTGGGN